MLASYQLAYILESSAGLVIYDSLLAEESARLCMRFGCCLYMNITHTRHSERTDLADSCSRSLTCRSCARHRRPSLQSAPAPCASEASERSPPPTDPEPPSRAARSTQPPPALAARESLIEMWEAAHAERVPPADTPSRVLDAVREARPPNSWPCRRVQVEDSKGGGVIGFPSYRPGTGGQ